MQTRSPATPVSGRQRLEVASGSLAPRAPLMSGGRSLCSGTGLDKTARVSTPGSPESASFIKPASADPLPARAQKTLQGPDQQGRKAY